MKWLRKKTPATVEPVIGRRAAVEAAYIEAEHAYRQACRNLADYLVVHPDRISLRGNRVFINVNHMANESPERRRLENIRMEKLSRRNELLAERATFVVQGGVHATT